MIQNVNHAEIDSHIRRAYYYGSDGYIVASLDLNSDTMTYDEDLTEEEKDEAYTAMRIEEIEFKNEFNID